ncbi:hypothetical protein LCGC14_2356640, partial [marine sediment metagenome]
MMAKLTERERIGFEKIYKILKYNQIYSISLNEDRELHDLIYNIKEFERIILKEKKCDSIYNHL